MIFRFCPVTETEQYRVEMEYWRQKGDQRRADLLEELMARAAASEKIPQGSAAESQQPATTLADRKTTPDDASR